MTGDAGAANPVGGLDPTGQALQNGIDLTELSLESSQLNAAAKQDSPPVNSMGDVNPRAAEVDYQHAQSAATAATGSGFEFTPEQINTQLAHCTEQLNDLRGDLLTAQHAEQTVHPPAPDAASVVQANAVRNMLTQTIAAIQADITYLSKWQATLTAAQARYMQTENLTTEQWNRLANGVQS